MMDGFEYRCGELYAGNLRIHDIAQQVGTPFYIYSAQGIASNYQRLNNAFGKRSHQINYAVKASPNLGILAFLNKLGSGFDVVSGGELTRALKAGSNPQRIFFSGIGKTEQEIRLAISSNIASINIESESELDRIQTIACSMNKVMNVSIRVNPDIDAKTHEYISTGLKENKFGLDDKTAIDLYVRINELPNVNASGIACHIGSQITSLDPLILAAKKVLKIINQLNERGITIDHLDMGGGLGIRYKDEEPPSLEAYVGELIKIVDKHHSHLNLAIEPGRCIIGNAGILITQVEYLKTNEDRHFAVVDAGMNDLLRPALYNAWMEISEVIQSNSSQTQSYDVVGPICESADFLGKQRRLAIKQGDFLAIQGSGAYAMSMSSNYNSRPRVAELLVHENEFHIIRKRESYQDLFNVEVIPDFLT